MIGWLAKGLLFVTIGLLAIGIARRGWAENETDQKGALASLAENGGRVPLFVVALGLAAYAAWQLWAAIVGQGREPLSLAKRVGWVGLAATYGLLAETALTIATGGAPSPDDDGPASPVGLTDRLLDLPGGAWVVAAIGFGTAAVGVYNLGKGVSGDFLDDIDTSGLSDALQRVLLGVGAAGFVARAIVLVLAGWLFIDAARRGNPERAAGLDDALDALARAQGGGLLLGLTGVGLVAAGAYDMVTFRRQRIRSDDD